MINGVATYAIQNSLLVTENGNFLNEMIQNYVLVNYY